MIFPKIVQACTIWGRSLSLVVRANTVFPQLNYVHTCTEQRFEFVVGCCPFTRKLISHYLKTRKALHINIKRALCAKHMNFTLDREILPRNKNSQQKITMKASRNSNRSQDEAESRLIVSGNFNLHE